MCLLSTIYIAIPNESQKQSLEPEVFCKKVALKNVAKFTRKQLLESFNKVVGIRPQALLRKRLQHRWCFPVNFAC